MFAITGATGKVGGAVARTLLAANHPIRVIVRDSAKGERWAALGAEFAIADSNDIRAMTAAVSGCAGAFVMLPPTFDPSPDFREARQTIEALHQALLAARPPKAVVLSTIGADALQPNLLNQLKLLEEGLSDLPMPLTYLRAAWFMENAAWDLEPARREGAISSYLQPLDKPFPMVSAEDVGVNAAELLLEDWSGRRIVELEGPCRVSPNDIAAAIGRSLGRQVRAQVVARDDWDRLFRSQGMINPLPRGQMLDGFNEGWIDFSERDATSRKGTIMLEQAIAALVATGGG
ncbi:NmrA family NAD(P)-binding protein [Tardiphaga sp. 862_B3_N4_1]|jgi:uncharacterized protein YbjT (DUF2867 family)|uniref:NmrA family NAD(P)-binding protein n=1 Tax=unclassified Tardiphaga TaxID=2631404 RepID=UPI003F246998